MSARIDQAGDRAGDQGWDCGLLLVGSIPLGTAAEVLDLVAERLGPTIERVPDGETGVRANWIAWQRPWFASIDGMVPLDEPERAYQLGPPFRLVDGVEPMTPGSPGFAAEAVTSYELFAARRADGAFRPDARFQVSIPTPFAPVFSFVAYESQGRLYGPYEQAVLADLEEICRRIPHRDLAIQWDVATEMSIFEELHPVPFLEPDPKGRLRDRLALLGDAVPDDVELGYHLCYGSMNNRHWKEPGDLGVCVETANAVIDRLDRSPTWFHVPVPIDRDDDAYHAPLGSLRLPEGTSLYLGLLHDRDGADGANRRIGAARRHTDIPFGLATECGLGRREAADVVDIIDLHVQVQQQARRGSTR